VSFDFLHVDGGSAVARTPMEHAEHGAGARFEVRDGWNIAVSYGLSNAEALACVEVVGWADTSHLGKLELQAGEQDLAAIAASVADGAQLELGTATRGAGAWWCPVTSRRALVICEPGTLPALRETLVAAAEMLLKRGAYSVYACATHAAFAPGTRDLLEKSPFTKVLVSDTVPLPANGHHEYSKIEVITVAPLFAEAILHIHEDRSVSALFRS